MVVSPSGLRLKDVAEVGFRKREMEGFYDIDGEGGAFLLVRKESEANTVATCRAVQAEVARLMADPRFDDMEQFLFFDQSELILTALNGLIKAGKLGGLLAFTVLLSLSCCSTIERCRLSVKTFSSMTALSVPFRKTPMLLFANTLVPSIVTPSVGSKR